MKRNLLKRVFAVLMFGVMVFGVASPAGAITKNLLDPNLDSQLQFKLPLAPTVKNNGFDWVISNNKYDVIVGGRITDEGSSPVTEIGFYYGFTGEGAAKKEVVDKSHIDSNGNYTYEIYGISPGKEIYLYAFATNAVGTGNADTTKFSFPEMLDLTMNPIKNVTETSATLSGSLDSYGPPASDVGFYYADNQSMSGASRLAVTPNWDFTYELTGLKPDTKYYAQVYGKSGDLVFRSKPLEFTTAKELKNAVYTSPVTSYTATSAVLGGTIGSALPVDLGVAYSEAVNPDVGGPHLVCSPEPAFGGEVKGLKPDTIYHIRAYGLVNGKYYYGADYSFRTKALPALMLSITGVSLDKSSLNLAVGDTATLIATVAPVKASNKTVVWSSDKPSVVKVDDGKLTAVSAGSATITVKTVDGDKTASCAVTVTKEIPSVQQPPVEQSTTGTAVETTLAGKQTLVFTLGQSKYTVNGKSFDMDTYPISENGRTMLPIRYLANPLGADLAWDGISRKATISFGSKIIELSVGKNKAKVNGQEQSIDSSNAGVTPMVIPPGRTMLPLRFIGENMGCSVVWDGAAKTVTVTYAAQ